MLATILATVKEIGPWWILIGLVLWIGYEFVQTMWFPKPVKYKTVNATQAWVIIWFKSGNYHMEHFFGRPYGAAQVTKARYYCERFINGTDPIYIGNDAFNDGVYVPRAEVGEYEIIELDWFVDAPVLDGFYEMSLKEVQEKGRPFEQQDYDATLPS